MKIFFEFAKKRSPSRQPRAAAQVPHSKVQLFGSVAQWVSAIATVIAVALAYFGFLEARVVFDYLGLKEKNAQFEMQNEKLADENAKLGVQNAVLRQEGAQLAEANEGLMRSNGRLETLNRLRALKWACLGVDSLGTDILNVAVNARGWMRNGTLVVQPGVKKDAVRLRTILETIKAQVLSELEPTDRQQLANELDKVAAKFGGQLDLIILPPFDEVVRPSADALEESEANHDIGATFKSQLFFACRAYIEAAVTK